jgi:hypothetical protein
MFVRCESVDRGPGPSDKYVTVKTNSGDIEEVIVHTSFVRDKMMEIAPVSSRNGSAVLIELPSETVSGSWRIWVPKDSLQQ